MLSFPMVHHLEYTDAGPLLNLELTIGPPFFGGRCLLLPGVGIPNGQSYLPNLRVLEDLKVGPHILC